MIDTKRLATDAAYWRECGAPEDATGAVSNGWAKKERGQWFWSPFEKLGQSPFNIGEWYSTMSKLDDCSYHEYTPRPQSDWVDGLPDAYLCPVGCGCLWRDNGDDTMSLYGPRSQSCDVCEPLPLDRLVPVKKIPTKAQRDRDELESVIFETGYVGEAFKGIVAEAILSRYNLEPKQ